MCELDVCRICLRNSLKLYRIDEYDLSSYYEKVVGLTICVKDALPPFICFECAAILKKFSRFKDKCHYTHNKLNSILQQRRLTYDKIVEIKERESILNQGTLGILFTNHRVKTFNIEHETIDITEKNNTQEELIALDCIDDLYSDDDIFDDPITDPVGDDLESKCQTNDDINIEEYKAGNDEQASSNLIEEVKMKKNVKLKKKSRKKKPVHRSNCDESDGETVISKNKHLNSKTKKYKFKSHDGKVKALAFLNSGYWKKSSLTEDEALKEFESRSQEKKYLNAAYKCTDCYRGFSQKSMLDRHVPQRHGEAAGSLVCRFCKMRFKSAYYLNKHMRQHYTKYECLRCNLVCNLENSALLHEEYHIGITRKCTHCDKEFRHLSTFYTHLRTHRSKHMCSLCGESFVSPLGLRLHTIAKHAVETECQDIAVKETTFCEICQIKFEKKEAYDKHLLHSAMHIDDNKIIDDDVTACLLEEENEVDEEDNQISEPLINRKSRVEKTLSRVRKYLPRKTTSKKPTTCHQCGKHFETQTACIRHHVAEHPGTSFFSPQERIICEICGASLAPGSMAAHQNQHTRRKMYTCDTCGRSFTTSTMLRNHMATHTGEKKYGCSLCEKRFTQNGSLSLHYRTFHLKQPYPKRIRNKNIKLNLDGFVINGKEE